MELDELNKKKADLLAELADIEAGIEAATSQDLITIAEMLHRLRCNYNHTDGCGWDYEKDYNKGNPSKMWAQSAHLSYLRLAKKLMAHDELTFGKSEELVAKVLTALRSVW